MKYKTKAIITGNVVEVYHYDKTVLRGKDLQSARAGNGAKKTSEGTSEMCNEKSQKDSLRRTRNTIRRTINSNTGKWGEKDKFLTLTFKEHLTDQTETNKLFTNFVKKLSYSIFQTQSKLKYLCVVERMGNGRIHYHVLFFNLPYKPVEEIAQIWGHGFVKINALDNVDNVGAYVCKYMSKTAVENSEKSAKEKDKKMYFVSRGLHKPIEVCDSSKNGAEQIATLRWEMADYKAYEMTFENEHQKVLYEQYNFDRKQ